ncbi:MAG: Clp1/GlmU family protein [Thermodesulfobacteriota bacterium]
MVLGAPDTGKSTLCRYLVYRAFISGHRVALMDLDLGQSHLGPPAALGLALFPPHRPGDEVATPEALYFIGQTSPLGAILEVVVGCRVLVDQAWARGCKRVVVNTSGLVQGAGALILKRAEAELLQPSLILGLQRSRELEPLLRGLGSAALPKDSAMTPPPMVGGDWGEGEITPTPTLLPQDAGSREITGWPILHLPVSYRAIRRGPEERRLYREMRFRHYFQKARRQMLPWRRLIWDGQPWGRGDPLKPETLEHFRQELGVKPLYGESQGRRAVLLLVEAPEVNRQKNSLENQDWGQVHWLTWPSLHWRLIGLLDGGRRTLGLGLILPGVWDPETLAIWTPLDKPALLCVRFLKVGKLRLNLRGQELSHV